jgi:hypothetical protein
MRNGDLMVQRDLPQSVETVRCLPVEPPLMLLWICDILEDKYQELSQFHVHLTPMIEAQKRVLRKLDLVLDDCIHVRIYCGMHLREHLKRVRVFQFRLKTGAFVFLFG